MVDHLVFFKITEGTEEREVESLVSALKSLREDVPGVVDLSVGEDFSGRSGGYTHALFVRFEDREGLKNYAGHPAHLAVVEKLDAISDGRIVVDYET